MTSTGEIEIGDVGTIMEPFRPSGDFYAGQWRVIGFQYPHGQKALNLEKVVTLPGEEPHHFFAVPLYQFSPSHGPKELPGA